MRRLALLAMALVLGVAAVPFVPATGGADDSVAGVLTAETEAWAFRVEYDIPLPLGPGTLARVAGEIRRSQAGENAKGIAAAPTQFDAVVGGTYADPRKPEKGDERNLPQVECSFPGHLLDTRFAFPTDTQAETAAVPPTAFATARCGAGPEVDVHATDVEAAVPGMAASRTLRSDGHARTVSGALDATAATRGTGLSIFGGAVTIGSLELSGRSRITGKPGEQHTETRVTLSDITAGGVTFSIADDRLVVGGTPVPIGSPAAQSVFDAVNAGLAPSGCRVAAGTDPNRYPQGFLFSRPEPRTGADADGTFAASYRAGLFVLCDLPATVTDNATVGNQVFSPQRAQAIIGFVYTSAATNTEPGGFGIGSLALPPIAPDVAGTNAQDGGGALPDLSPAPTASAPSEQQATAAARSRPAPFLRFGPMDAATRWVLGIVAFVVWAVLTHIGARRLRGVFSA